MPWEAGTAEIRTDPKEDHLLMEIYIETAQLSDKDKEPPSLPAPRQGSAQARLPSQTDTVSLLRGST